MQFIDDAEFQVAIDLDGGGKITSLIWREMEFDVPFRGSVIWLVSDGPVGWAYS
jgi:aldose 1-epimerase